MNLTEAPNTPAVRFLLDGRIDTRGAAAYLGLSRTTLDQWRSQGKGPRFLKPCGRVWYRKEDLDRWLADAEVASTAQAHLLAKKGGG